MSESESRFLTLDGGRRLHYRMAGDGDVTVVFEAGLGMSGVCWGLVAPEIATQARTVVYDRAGIGSSDDGPKPRTLTRLAADLGALLDALPGPFVLVGHSWGGPIVRLRAARARAVVLVDPSDEFATRPAAWQMAIAGPLTRTLAAAGIYRAAARIGSALPPELFAQFRDENFGRRAARALHDEVRHFRPGLAGLRATPPDRGGVPHTIISAGNGAAHTEVDRHVIAAGSGHNVMFDDPGLVIDEIRRAIAQ
ncbi:alpha/beta hydrolase [Actinoplanes sp. NPDC026619]|uniref:alpha/beta fold hydrolase n=1 Tax=Actinoplanes sp. NPDC026619 TaxID=3155798 RepID=UPI0033CB3331